VLKASVSDIETRSRRLADKLSSTNDALHSEIDQIRSEKAALVLTLEK
jgi:hypothetical protein